MYFVDAGFQVICFDYTGCYTSEGSTLGGYTQAVYDLDAVLSWCDKNEIFRTLPLYLFGHNGHYSYFLTDAAIEYQKTNPKDSINKELYMEHDTSILKTICSFFSDNP